VAPTGRDTLLVHRVEDTPVDGLQPVADVRQGPPRDDAHRVVDVTLLHLVLDADTLDVRGVNLVCGVRRL
jgi:hypothetical protein